MPQVPATPATTKVLQGLGIDVIFAPDTPGSE